MTPEAIIEAILFYKGEPVSFSELAALAEIREEDIPATLERLKETLQGRGIALIYNNDTVMLATARETSATIEHMLSKELEKELSKPVLETLAIVLYRGPLARTQIDYIRGVNSQFILRTLAIRGLIEKVHDPNNPRITLYQSTAALMGHLGLSRTEDLPEYAEVQKEISEHNEEQINVSV